MDVSYPWHVTTTIAWPIDTALSMLESLQLPELAGRIPREPPTV